MLGMYAALRTYPHLLDDEGIRIRSGTMVDVRLPWQAVREVSYDERTLPSSIRSFQRTGPDEARQLHVPMGARTNVTAELTGPTSLRTSPGEETVVSVSFWVDEPREFVRGLRERLGATGAPRQP